MDVILQRLKVPWLKHVLFFLLLTYVLLAIPNLRIVSQAEEWRDLSLLQHTQSTAKTQSPFLRLSSKLRAATIFHYLSATPAELKLDDLIQMFGKPNWASEKGNVLFYYVGNEKLKSSQTRNWFLVLDVSSRFENVKSIKLKSIDSLQ